jgi:hypothetical protein
VQEHHSPPPPPSHLPPPQVPLNGEPTVHPIIDGRCTFCCPLSEEERDSEGAGMLAALVAAVLCAESNRTSPISDRKGAANATGGGGSYINPHDVAHAEAKARAALAEGRATPGQKALVLILDMMHEALKTSLTDDTLRPHLEHLGARSFKKGEKMNSHGHGAGGFPSDDDEPSQSQIVMCRFGGGPRATTSRSGTTWCGSTSPPLPSPCTTASLRRERWGCACGFARYRGEVAARKRPT